MAILTVRANAAVSPYHDRMPLILGPESFDRWLDCSSGESLTISELMRPAPGQLLEAVEVDPALNNPRNEGAHLLVPPRPRLL